jgi:hypothetical protein
MLSEAEVLIGQRSVQRISRGCKSAGEIRKDVRRPTSCLQESRLADITLDVLGLLVDLQLRLCWLGVLVLAIPLGRCFGSLCSVSLQLAIRSQWTYVSHLDG